MNNRKLKKILKQNAVDNINPSSSRPSYKTVRHIVSAVACLLAVCLIGVGYVTMVRFVGRPSDANDGSTPSSQPGNNSSQSGLSSDTSTSETTDVITASDTAAGTDNPYGLLGDTVSVYTVNRGHFDEWGGDDLTGEYIHDMLVVRNNRVKDLLNCNIDISYEESDDKLTKDVLNLVLSASGEHIIVSAPSGVTAELLSKGLLSDLNASENLDFTASCWDSSMAKALEIGGKLYFATGDISINTVLSAQFILGNTGMLAAASITDPYALVREGKWTLETVMALAKNGNGLYLGTGNGCIALINAAGARLTGNDLGLSSDWDNGRLSSLCGLLAWTDAVSTATSDSASSMLSVRSLGYLISLTNDQSISDSYDILPLPKADETDRNYRAPLSGNAMYYSIPMLNGAEDAACVMQCTASAMNNDIYDILAMRFCLNTRSAEMLELIMDNMCYCLDTALSLGSAGGVSLTNVIGAGKELNTALAVNRKLLEVRLATLVASISE